MKREKSAEKLVFSGKLAGGTVSETILQTGKNRYEILGQAAFPNPVRWELLAAILTLPPEQIAISIDKKTVAIPAFYKELSLFKGAAKKVIVDLPGGMRYCFNGNMKLEIQDNRKWQNTIGIRFFFSPYRGNISSASLKLNLEIQPPEFCKVDLGKAANRTFEDRDGSGWTGQGAANDLSMIKSGLLEYARVPFCIGADRKAIVAGRVAPKTIRLELPKTGGDIRRSICFMPVRGLPYPGKLLDFLMSNTLTARSSRSRCAPISIAATGGSAIPCRMLQSPVVSTTTPQPSDIMRQVSLWTGTIRPRSRSGSMSRTHAGWSRRLHSATAGFTSPAIPISRLR